MHKCYYAFSLCPLIITEEEGYITHIEFSKDKSDEHYHDHNLVIDVCIDQLKDYFAGKSCQLRFPFTITGSPKAQECYRYIFNNVLFGTTTSYGDVARQIHSSARAVGQFMAKNPLPFLVPCHRIISHDGSLGGYQGGLELKRALILLEYHYMHN